jgi:two-component system, cell cycle sensor histidine kinase and response regulator CckA
MAANKRRRPPSRRTEPRAAGVGTVATTTTPPPPPPPAPISTTKVQRELDVHRQELAAQNEELRRANGDLTTAKDRYAQLYDGAPIALFTLDEAGIIIEANLSGAGLLDTPRNVLFGRSFDEVVAAASRASFRSFRRDVMSGSARLVHETTLAMGTRRIRVRIEAARSAADPNAAPECLLCITDESEREQIEAERRAFQARVAEVNRVEALGTLAGAIAHDLNNILSIVLAHADLVLLGDGEPTDTRDSVEHIRGAALRAAELSRQMIAYCGRERLRSEPLDVSMLVRDMSNLLVESGSKDIELALELADALPLVIGDSGRLQQVVLNLVVNAADAIAGGSGRIVLRTRESFGSPYPRGVVIECTDDGHGMDSPTAQRAFDPFFSTRKSGRGLGLAVVHGTVRAHGGTVTVESAVGKGTTFRVFLPAALAGSPSNTN